MKITEKWLTRKNACREGVVWFKAQKETDAVRVLEKLIADEKLLWANWLIVWVMTYKQYVSYAIYAAEQVIEIFQREHPTDNRPRLAIRAAKKCISDPSTANKRAAAAADSDSADAAAYSARAAAYSARAAAYSAAAADSADAAYSAAAAAYSARAAAYSAADSDSADSAAYSARDAADAATTAMRVKILQYGIELLKRG